MHKIFGTKEKVEYTDREGAYLIPFRGNMVGVIQTSKGYFLLGGGLESGESHLACIKRECMEEAGYLPLVKEKVCSAEAFTTHPTIKYFHPIQTYYCGELLEKAGEPIEQDHRFCWIEYDRLIGMLFVEMQNWALEQAAAFVLNKLEK